MKAELHVVELPVIDTEVTECQDFHDAALRALAEAELMLIGGGGGDVIWG